ncbi:hypothetical protein V6N11_053817 [Hibiscus sabdariffa]|uniref:Uncharacterized protein n=1 Tax=Hibiscus sabdariffa TaxID=183260 RepID=A0ABR2S1Z9_9ROSI
MKLKWELSGGVRDCVEEKDSLIRILGILGKKKIGEENEDILGIIEKGDVEAEVNVLNVLKVVALRAGSGRWWREGSKVTTAIVFFVLRDRWFEW